MFHLDYLSCFLTVLATILLARKSWIGLLIAIANSLIVCAIGLRTSQLGFIPANLFCISVYAFSMRSWLRERAHSNRDRAQRQGIGSVADGHRMSPVMQHRTAAGTRRIPSDLNKSTTIKTTINGFTCLDPTHFHEYFATDLPVELASSMARSQVVNAAHDFTPPGIPFSQDARVNFDKRTAEKIQSSALLYGTNTSSSPRAIFSSFQRPWGGISRRTKPHFSRVVLGVFVRDFFFVRYLNQLNGSDLSHAYRQTKETCRPIR